jgi:hypothetical protein
MLRHADNGLLEVRIIQTWAVVITTFLRVKNAYRIDIYYVQQGTALLLEMTESDIFRLLLARVDGDFYLL